MSDTKKSSFALGYSLVFHSMLMYFIFGAFSTSGMNVWVPAFVAMYGWNSSTLLAMGTIGSLIGVIGSIIFGIVVSKTGAKKVLSITLTICGIAIIFFGHIHSVAQYLICFTMFNFFGHGFCNIASNAVIGNWFPGRKGFILGITTMGLPAASFLFVPILSKSIGALGVTKAFLIIGAVITVLGIVSWFWVVDTPQERGLLPDNGKVTAQGAALQAQNAVKWKLKDILTNKNSWMIGIGYGMLFLVTQGMVSQTVSYLVERGMENATAVTMLSMAAAVGIVGSFIWGILDDKIGTKKTSVIYACWYILTFIMLFINGSLAICIVGVILLGSSLGGIGNLTPSMIISCFGPKNYPAVSSVIMTIVNVVRSLAFLVMAAGLQILGGYRMTTLVLCILSAVALVVVLSIRTPQKAAEK